ncbi:MAG: hypothetical protein L6U99_10865 [Clostridium sp.]|nr:MAG: hypothetical protein L6U99_10865 [Clostridium sp.]
MVLIVLFEIVGTIEADPFKGKKLVITLHLEKAIIGHSAGETCIVTTESGKELKSKDCYCRIKRTGFTCLFSLFIG